MPFTIEIAMQDSFLIPHSFHCTKSNVYISVISSEKFVPEKTHFLNFDTFPISFKYRLWTASNRRICFLDVSEIFYSNIKADIIHWGDPISKRNLILCILWKKNSLHTYSCVTLFSAFFFVLFKTLTLKFLQSNQLITYSCHSFIHFL